MADKLESEDGDRARRLDKNGKDGIRDCMILLWIRLNVEWRE